MVSALKNKVFLIISQVWITLVIIPDYNTVSAEASADLSLLRYLIQHWSVNFVTNNVIKPVVFSIKMH